MTRAAVTFTEIFIVLALIFIIQTVVNFNLFEGVTEGTVEDDVPDLVTLTITGSNLLYFRFQKRVIVDTDRPHNEQTLWLEPQTAWVVGGEESEWIIDRTGRCGDYHPIDIETVQYGSVRDQLESFQEVLKDQFGIAMNITYRDIEGEQKIDTLGEFGGSLIRAVFDSSLIRAVFSWSPADLAKDAELGIGELLIPWFYWDEDSGDWYPPYIPSSRPIMTRISYYGNRIVAQDPQELRFDPERFVVGRVVGREDPFSWVLVAPGHEMRAFGDVADDVVLGSDYAGFTFGRLRPDEGIPRKNITNCRFSNITGVRESLVFLDDEG